MVTLDFLFASVKSSSLVFFQVFNLLDLPKKDISFVVVTLKEQFKKG